MFRVLDLSRVPRPVRSGGWFAQTAVWLVLTFAPAFAQAQDEDSKNEAMNGRPTNGDTTNGESAATSEEASAEEPATVLVLEDVPDSVAVRPDSSQVTDMHRQDSATDRGFRIITADGESQLRLWGSVRVNGGFDLKGLQESDFFDTYAIPVGVDRTEPRFFMSASHQTRVGVDARRASKIGDISIRIEADFRGLSNSLRLRHAFASVPRLVVGQTWTTFSDIAALPLTVDFEGPNSSITKRTVQVRYGREFAEGSRWAVSIESPEPEVSFDEVGITEPAFQSYPDVAGRFRYVGESGHAQLAGIARSITVRVPDGTLEYLAGWGVLTTGRWTPSEKDELLLQFEIGRGIASFITALAGRNLDAVFDPATEQYETLPVLGGFAALGHEWNDDVRSTLTVGWIRVEPRSFQPDDAFRDSRYFSFNAFWMPASGTRIGVEYTWGRRENKDGQSGDASRLSFIAMYDF